MIRMGWGGGESSGVLHQGNNDELSNGNETFVFACQIFSVVMLLFLLGSLVLFLLDKIKSTSLVELHTSCFSESQKGDFFECCVTL